MKSINFKLSSKTVFLRINFINLFQIRNNIYGILDFTYYIEKLLSAVHFSRKKTKRGYVYSTRPLEVWNLFPLLGKIVSVLQHSSFINICYSFFFYSKHLCF